MILRFVIAGVSSILLLSGQVQSPATSAISLEEVVRLTRAGVGEELVITRVKKSGRSFDLSTDEILELKRSGVTDSVIRILMDPTLPYTPPAPKPPEPRPVPPPEPAAPKKPINPLIAALPAEPGVYVRGQTTDSFRRLDFKLVAVSGSGGKVIGVLTAGLKKGTVSGYLVGSAAKTHLSGPSQYFYVRMPEKVAAEDIILIKTDTKKDRREINFGPDAAKPSFAPEMVKQHQSAELETGVFRFDCAALDPGEYVFLVLGSAEEKKGIVAKGWEFGIGSPSKD